MKMGKTIGLQSLEFLSNRVKRQPPNPFAALVPLMKDPKMSILAQGVPPMEIFPLSSISITLQDGTPVSLSTTDVQNAQRYSPFAWGPLLGWCRRHMEALHSPPINDKESSNEPPWDVAVSAGSMSSVEMAFSMFLEPGTDNAPGDSLLVEEFSFTASLDCLKAMGCTSISVPMDQHGIIPSKLREVLENCKRGVEEGNVKIRKDNCFSGSKMPKLLYTIPVGQNPTGGRLPAVRYHQIYDVCQEYNLLIVEDDPYFYLQHHHEKAKSATEKTALSLGPSFLSLDTDGRVLRLDSFSKVLAPGFRLGWVTGPRAFIRAFNAMAYCGSQNGCSLSMTILGRMLEQFEQSNQFETNLLHTQSLLRRRCQSLVSLVEANLGDLVDFHPPKAGLFLWLKLKPGLTSFPTDDILHAAMKKHCIVFLPGSVCTVMPSSWVMAKDKIEERISGSALRPDAEIRRYMRLSYVAPESTYAPAITNLRALIIELCK